MMEEKEVNRIKREAQGIYLFDEVFPSGSMIYDKETGKIFQLKKEKHKKRILENPNNYRVAHKGDYGEFKKQKKK